MATILIIDDNSDRIREVRHAIRYQRYDVRTTRATSHAADLVASLEPDLVVLGLGADTAKAVEICDRARTECPFDDLPILLVGEAEFENGALACMDCGADDWLSLPLAECLIESRIRAMISGRKERERLQEKDRSLAQRIESLDSTLDTLDQAEHMLEESRRSERFLATHDRLTGIPNRQLFDEFCERAVKFASRYGQNVAVMCLDLDRFARINDSLSHSTGDQLLKSVAERATECVRSSEMVARLGGDELLVLLLNLNSPGDAARVAEKMLMTISAPHLIAGQELRITPSIGIAVYPDHGESRDALVRNATAALRSVKDEGGNNHAFYVSTMNEETPRRERLEEQLGGAIERDELVVYYQPQIDARKGALIGAEALVRWNHPELGLVSPAEFIPIAEESGFINEMGAWVLRRACLEKLEWETAGLGAFPVSVNVSFRQLKSRSFAEVVVQVLEETGLDPEHLDIEITENMIMDDVESAREALTILSDIGVTVSIDDFGTGYSSLSVLGKFPAHTLKIDRAFVIDIATNPVKAAITRTVIAVANELGMRIIAEGVEDLEQMNFLASIGCELMQGYLFGRPVDTEEFVETWRDGETEVRLKD